MDIYLLGMGAMLCFCLLILIALVWKYRELKHKNSNSLRVDEDYQLIKKVYLKKQRLMNGQEVQVFYKTEKLLPTGWRLMSQVSMGEFIELGKEHKEIPKEKIDSIYNCKRVDMLVINNSGYPMVVIECQGTGHYQNNAEDFDALKEKICERARIEFVEVHYNEPVEVYILGSGPINLL